MNHGQYGRMARAGSFQGPYRRSARKRAAQFVRTHAVGIVGVWLLGIMAVAALILLGG